MSHKVWEQNYLNGRYNKYPFDKVVSFVFNYYGSVKDRKAVKILDLGCGGGTHTEFLLKEGFSYYAIDGSKTAVEITQRILENNGGNGVVVEGDFCNMPFLSNFFDAVIDRQSLGHNSYHNVIKIVDSIHRILKPLGFYFGMMFSIGHPHLVYGKDVGSSDFVDCSVGNFSKSGLVHAFDKEELLCLFRKFHIKQLKCHCEFDLINEQKQLNGEEFSIVVQKMI